MKHRGVLLLSIAAVILFFGQIFEFSDSLKIISYANAQDNKPVIVKLNAFEAEINSAVAEVVQDERLSARKGVGLKQESEAAIDGERDKADLVFKPQLPAGRYVIYTYTETDDEGAELMKVAKSKFESMFMRISVGEGRPTKRVIAVPWNRPRQMTGIFDISGIDDVVQVWLPRGVRMEYLELRTYSSPKVPEKAQLYNPTVVPPSSHPRLWINSKRVAEVRENLTADENRQSWEAVKERALKPYEFSFDPQSEVSFQVSLERAAEAKAFYYLMTGDKEIGREAVDLMMNYLSVVEFGNLLDITRERGRAIYFGSLVYDWCYDLISVEEKQKFSGDLKRHAEGMEIGWPPFIQSVLTGHGSEAQVSRDLLSMSIAIYDEDPLPYQYTSYRILEELVPVRGWQYQSPRHNQGVGYGAYRTVWDMHAALLFLSMTGEPAFHDNQVDLFQFWMYMRLPDGRMFHDGDGINAVSSNEFAYWKNPLLTFLYYGYTKDPLIKGELARQGGINGEPVLFLLLNDPSVTAMESENNLPLTKDFGPILGSMIARTGWNIDLSSDDVVAEIKGGGYHFGNHQHSDAGALQIYFRGMQVADLGLYGFYGTPYDMNFNKRSIAHSMSLIRDPNEKFLNTESNDGGTRLNQRHPETPEIAMNDSWFNNGKVISSDFGPFKQKPDFSYFSVDLTGAYSEKIESYNKGFCFLNLFNDTIPAVIILTDDIHSANPEFEKYWQINTHNKPEITSDGVILSNSRQGIVGKTHVDMVIPDRQSRVIDIFGGDDAHSSFGVKYEIPGRIKDRDHPEISGFRIMISPKQKQKNDRFVTIFQMVKEEREPFAYNFNEIEQAYLVSIAQKLVVMSKGEVISSEFFIEITDEKQVILTGMNAGKWRATTKDGTVVFLTSLQDRNTLCFNPPASGRYIIKPE